MNKIQGYRLGDRELPPSPITLSELQLLQESLLFGVADVGALRRSKAILEPQVEAILDVWYGFVGSLPQLLNSFQDTQGEPNVAYLGQVRARFARWIVDTAAADYDATWLSWQAEIARRHHRTSKNKTDGADASAIVPMRYLIALVYPITTTLRPFLERGAASEADLNAMQEAWRKSVLLQAIIWSYPYVREGDF